MIPSDPPVVLPPGHQERLDITTAAEKGQAPVVEVEQPRKSLDEVRSHPLFHILRV